MIPDREPIIDDDAPGTYYITMNESPGPGWSPDTFTPLPDNPEAIVVAPTVVEQPIVPPQTPYPQTATRPNDTVPPQAPGVDAWNPNAPRVEAMIGTYDGWAGQVVKTFYGTNETEPTTGSYRAILVKRAAVKYDVTTYAASGVDVPPVASQPQRNVEAALPLPARQDQGRYLVTAGDIVTVLTGRDGRNYFINDELPFMARVVTNGAATEANNGGAGNLSLKVRRQYLTGDPASVVPSLSDVPGATGGTFIEYSNVLPDTNGYSHHGWRVGDYVLVQRRGLYFIAYGAQITFPAKVATAGPASEANFTTNHYWLQEITATVTYGGDNAWTATTAQRTQTDPSSGAGKPGRWIDGINYGEGETSHLVPTNQLVLVSCFAGLVDQTHTASPWYAFNHRMTTWTPPVGTVWLWFGAKGAIGFDALAGWALCDGGTYNGFATPNMNGLFPRGQTGNELATGGLDTHSHDTHATHYYTVANQVPLVDAQIPLNDLDGPAFGLKSVAIGPAESGYEPQTVPVDGEHAEHSTENNIPAYQDFYFIVYVGE